MAHQAQSFDIAIVGNGSVASALAFELQRRNEGISVAIVGPKGRAGSASMAAGAMLNVFAELDAGLLDIPIFSHKFELARKATELWPGWIAELREAAGGQGPELKFGTYVLRNGAGDEQDDDAYDAIKAALKRYQEPFEITDPRKIDGYNPSVSGRAFEAIRIPREGYLDPRRLLATYEQAFARGGSVTQIEGTVERVTLGAGQSKQVIIAGGTAISAPHVVLASGAETRNIISQIPEIKDRVIPLFFGIGAALLLDIRVDAPAAVIRTPNRALACGIHMVPQGPRQVYIGASNQISPWPETSPRLTSVQFLSDGAMEQLNASYYNAELKHVFLGYRPTSADTLPMVGETSVPGLFVLTGTKRDGLHNSPILAQDMANRLTGKAGIVSETLKPERKVIRWLSKDAGVELAVRHLRAAGLQHGLRLPRSNWDPMVADMLHRHVEEVYQKSGADYGIPPEMLDVYSHGHVTSDQ